MAGNGEDRRDVEIFLQRDLEVMTGHQAISDQSAIRQSHKSGLVTATPQTSRLAVFGKSFGQKQPQNFD